MGRRKDKKVVAVRKRTPKQRTIHYAGAVRVDLETVTCQPNFLPQWKNTKRLVVVFVNFCAFYALYDRSSRISCVADMCLCKHPVLIGQTVANSYYTNMNQQTLQCFWHAAQVPVGQQKRTSLLLACYIPNVAKEEHMRSV